MEQHLFLWMKQKILVTQSWKKISAGKWGPFANTQA